jgi:hypothetical protein
MKIKKSQLELIIKEEVSKLTSAQKKILREKILKEDSWQNDLSGLASSLRNVAEQVSRLSKMQDVSLDTMKETKQKLVINISDILRSLKAIKF